MSLAVTPLTAAWTVRADGTFEAAPAGAVADLRLALSPWSLPAFLADPARWNEFVREEGDADFGGALKDLARTLPWFVEEMFAKALGPVAGQRVADAGRKLLAFPEYAAQRVTDSAVGYARDEAALVTGGHEMRRFTDDLRDVEARVDALAGRIEALGPRVTPIR